MVSTKNKQVFDVINEGKNFAILTHRIPDGDAIGSSIALLNLIKKMGKKADFLLEKTALTYVRFDMFDLENVAEFDLKHDNYDAVFILDSSTTERLEKRFLPILNNVNKTIVIDHHVNNFIDADIKIVDESKSSTGNLIYNLIIDSHALIKSCFFSCLLIINNSLQKRIYILMYLIIFLNYVIIFFRTNYTKNQI